MLRKKVSPNTAQNLVPLRKCKGTVDFHIDDQGMQRRPEYRESECHLTLPKHGAFWHKARHTTCKLLLASIGSSTECKSYVRVSLCMSTGTIVDTIDMPNTASNTSSTPHSLVVLIVANLIAAIMLKLVAAIVHKLGKIGPAAKTLGQVVPCCRHWQSTKSETSTSSNHWT